MFAPAEEVRKIAAALIKVWEGFRTYAYPDPASPLAKVTPGANWGHRPAQEVFEDLSQSLRNLSGDPWTLGYGFTSSVIGPHSEMSKEDAETALDNRLERFQNELRPLIKVPLTANQEAALLSLQFNIGTQKFAGATLLTFLNAGKFSHAQGQFSVWKRAGGQVLQGLVNRRKAEAELFGRE